MSSIECPLGFPALAALLALKRRRRVELTERGNRLPEYENTREPGWLRAH